MINNQEFIKACNSDSIKYREYIILKGTTEKIDVIADLYQTAYKDTHFIGTFNISYIKFNAENNINYKKKEFEYYKEVNGVAIKIGTYIVTEVKDSDTDEEVKVTAYDYGLKFANKYKSNLDYMSNQVTLYQVLQECCQKCGVILKNASITNGNFIVDSNQFEEDAMFGDVVSAISYITGDFATITPNGELELRFTNATNEVIEDYVELLDKRDTQPITSVSIGLTDIEGENVVLKDQALIDQYGEHWLIINDVPFAYTEEKRRQLIDGIFNKVKGFSYSAFESKYSFKPYLELGDLIQFRNKEGQLINSIVLGIESNYDDITLSAKSVTKAVVEYQNPKSAYDIAKRTEILVDKQNQTITSVVSQVDGQNKKITKVEQTVSELNSKISDIADITKMQESNNGILIFESINQSEPININIHPIVDNISYLYPRNNLYPSDSLFMTDRRLRFTNTKDNTIVDYILPDDLLYYDSNNYDEFILDYDLQACKIIKRVEYNADGTTYILPTEKEINYTYPTIELTEGDYKIELLGYNTAYMQIRLMSQNIYTTQFATKVEMNSAINQKADEISTEVNKKVGKEEFGTQVKQNWEAVQIAWNTVSQLIQFIIENDNAEIQIKENANNKLMTLNKNGQKFYKNNKEFGKMGVHKDEKGNGYIAFSVPIEGYNSSIQDGMAWGVTTPKGNFYPIFNMKNFSIGAPNSGEVYGQLELVSSDLIVAGGGFGGIRAGNVRITGDDVSKSLTFEDPETGDILMTIIPQNYEFGTNVEINILNAIKFFRNAYGSNSLRVGQNGCLLTDDGSMQGNSLTLTGVPSNDISILASGEVHCSRLVQTSLEENKKNFEKLQNGLEIIDNTDIYKYNFKSENDTDKKHIGFVIGKNFNYSKQLTAIDKEQNEIGVDNYAMTSVAYKAIQELHQIVQEQQKIIEEQNRRIEILENKIKGGK